MIARYWWSITHTIQIFDTIHKIPFGCQLRSPINWHILTKPPSASYTYFLSNFVSWHLLFDSVYYRIERGESYCRTGIPEGSTIQMYWRIIRFYKTYTNVFILILEKVNQVMRILNDKLVKKQYPNSSELLGLCLNFSVWINTGQGNCYTWKVRQVIFRAKLVRTFSWKKLFWSTQNEMKPTIVKYWQWETD